MLSFLHRESKSIIGAATIVGTLSFFSRIVGFVRDRILAGEFGAGDTLDIYYAAFKIPDLLFHLMVVGAISACFIPLFLSHYNRDSQQAAAWRFTNNIVHLLFLAMIILSLLLILLAPQLTKVIVPGFSDLKQASVVDFMRIMFAAQILLAISMVYGSVLQSLKRFFFFALAPIFYNFGIIVGAVWLVDGFGEIGLAFGVVLGACLHLAVQLFGLHRTGYRYSFVCDIFNKDARTLLKLMAPRTLGLAVNQLLFVILGIFASWQASGSLTIFQFAYNIQFFPVGIIGVSFAIAVFPSLSQKQEQHDTEGFVDLLGSTIRQLIYLLVPMTILFLILRAQIVRVVVGAGEFDWPSTIATANTLAFFALTFIPQSLVYIFARAFYSLHDTITPLVTGAASVLIGVLFSFILLDDFGVIALAMGFSISALIQAVLLWIFLRQRLGTLHESTFVTTFYKIAVAGILSSLVMQALKPFMVSLISLDTFFGVFIQGLIAGGAGLIIYLIAGKLLGIEEQQHFFSSLKRNILRRAQPTDISSLN